MIVWRIREDLEKPAGMYGINTGGIGPGLCIFEDYKEFISKCKTERECVTELSDWPRKGARDLATLIEEKQTLKPGDRSMPTMRADPGLVVIGSQPMENGLGIIGAHVDSPRLDLNRIPV